jgi:tetratricopeptide (TPR) repeat protein
MDEATLIPQTLEQAGVLVETFCVDGEWSEVDFNALVMCCLQYSLLRVTARGGSKFYSMHILVQSYLQAKGDMIQGHRPGPLVVRLLASSITWSDDYKHLAFNRLLLPHLRQIRLEDVVEAGDHFDFGYVMNRTGDGRLAVAHLERCVEIRRSLGEEHAKTLATMANLSNAYDAIGSYQKSLEIREKVLDVDRRTLGVEHLTTLSAAANLAVSYHLLERYEEAAKLFDQVLEARRRILGPEAVLTVKTMSNLARSYGMLGRDQEALDLDEQVLEIRTRSIEPESPETLSAMSRLSNSYYIVGRTREALELNQQALEMQKRALGDEHPDLLYTIRSRLSILEDLGMKEQLRDLLRVTLPVHKKVLGADHPTMVRLRRRYATELSLL